VKGCWLLNCSLLCRQWNTEADKNHHPVLEEVTAAAFREKISFNEADRFFLHDDDIMNAVGFLGTVTL